MVSNQVLCIYYCQTIWSTTAHMDTAYILSEGQHQGEKYHRFKSKA